MDKLKSIEDGIDRDEEFKKIKNGSFENQVLEYQELYPLDEYPGEFPVRILKNRFSTYFNHYSNGVENTLKKMNGDRIIDKIIWVFEEGKMQIPNCSIPKNGKCIITLHESYLAYLWGVAYFIFLQYESKAQHDNGISHNDDYFITDKMLSRSETLFRWALSLRMKINAWDCHLPSPLPTAILIDSEAAYCWQVSELCCYALTFIAYHELSHGIYGIDHSIDSKRQEQDADNLAMSFIKDPIPSIPKDHTILGILLASISSLFFLNSPHQIASKTHPDPDSRIFNVLENMVEKSDELVESYETVVIIAFRTFSLIQEIDDDKVIREEGKTPRQIIELYLELFDNYRS